MLDERTLELLRFPIGRFEPPAVYTNALIERFINNIENLPEQLRKAVKGMNDEQLDTPYRPDGWTIRQVIHHLADSHMNAYIRTKLAATETNPTIKPYNEEEWAKLEDYKAPAALSLDIIDAVHKRWVLYLRSLTKEQLMRTYIHPQYEQQVNMQHVIALYSWHSRHHLSHITTLKERKGW